MKLPKLSDIFNELALIVETENYLLYDFEDDYWLSNKKGYGTVVYKAEVPEIEKNLKNKKLDSILDKEFEDNF